MWQRLKDDCRDFPATMAFCALWVVVFVAMTIVHYRQGNGLTLGQFLLGLRGGHRFGDMTLRELYAGEIWRPLTASFVHYGILHIGMNLYALYQLGCLVESWYGSSLFVAIYVVTGAGGNLVSGLLRSWAGSNPMIASGGGSTVVMGLVAVCAVIGWRSKTEIGVFLRNQMLLVLGLTAALGLILPLLGMPIIDNWGHAGGTIMGFFVGLAYRPINWFGAKQAARFIGFVSCMLIVASAFAQLRDDRDEIVKRRMFADRERLRVAALDLLIVRLEEVHQTYKAVTAPRVLRRGAIVTSLPQHSAGELSRPADPEELFFRTVLDASLNSLVSMQGTLNQGGTAVDFRRLIALTRRTQVDPPTLEEFREYEARIESIDRALRRDRDFARYQSIAIGLLPRID